MTVVSGVDKVGGTTTSSELASPGQHRRLTAVGLGETGRTLLEHARTPAGQVMSGWGDLACLQARRADIHFLLSAAAAGADRLNIRIPTSLRAPVGVGNVVPETGTFSANITLR